jgi:probable HAF family extracellular repeat protein
MKAWLSAFLLCPLTISSYAQHYVVTDLGTLGGTNSSAEGINNRGLIAGFSTLPGDTTTHVVLWQKRKISDLGTPGLNSLTAYPFNDRGEGAVHSEIFTLDPLGEDFCGFGTHLGCPPVVWQKGALHQLPTLGGNNGHANQVNNRGEVGGVAENTERDSTCIPDACVENICPFQVLKDEPVLWKHGKISKLPTIPGDPDGEVLSINDNGQATGTSGQCIGSASEALHAVLWQHGKVIDLGNLGGTTNNHPQYLNNLGDVVGYSNLPGDQVNHAFLWRRGLMSDLGTLPGDVFSFGEAINDADEVGGLSCDLDFNCRAFVWREGAMQDVNTLISGSSDLFLLDVLSINSRGELVGDAFRMSDGEVHGYVATTLHTTSDATATSALVGVNSGVRPGFVLPEYVRAMLRQRKRVGGPNLGRHP